MSEENTDKLPEEVKTIEESNVVEEHHQSSEDSQMFEPESFDDEYESGEGLLTGNQYDIPDSADTFVDTTDGKVINKEDLTPFDMIKAIAKENGTELKKPANGCKHCYGRGFEGLETLTKMPIPCRCLFRGRNDESDEMYDSQKMNKKISRAQKRRMAMALRKHFEMQRKVMKRRLAEGKSFTSEDEEESKPTNQLVNKVLKEYLKQKSLKKTSIAMKMTLTETKKIIKENKSKLEKIEKKKVKEKA